MALKFTKAEVDTIIEMLEDGKSLTEVIRHFKTKSSRVDSFVANCIFLSAKERTPEHQKFREKILDILLGETVVKKALVAVSENSEKRSLKVTTLLNLTKAEIESLEKQGYANFIEEVDRCGLTLKVEETKETIPPDRKILEKLLGLIEGESTVDEVAKQLTPFSPPHPSTPEV